MALLDSDLSLVRQWVEEQNEQIGDLIDQVRIEIDVDARAVTVVECRPPWDEGSGSEWTRQEIARMRYTSSTGLWTLYWPDRNSKFHRYDDLGPTRDVTRLILEIEEDPTCIFWG